MLGAIIGDIVGSVYEGKAYQLSKPLKQITKLFIRTDFEKLVNSSFPLFQKKSTYTDDTVLTIAIADAILNQKDYAKTVKEYGLKYPKVGYGGSFIKWLNSDSLAPYNSFGNGAAMRVSAVAWAFDTLDKVLEEAEKTASITHNHLEGIKGAKSVASAIFMARQGASKESIKNYIVQTFKYDLSRTIEEIRPTYTFDVTCQGSVPEAIIAFLDSTNFETSIRLAVSLGGDTDTQAAIAGSIAEAFYKNISPEMVWVAQQKLAPELWEIIKKFRTKYM